MSHKPNHRHQTPESTDDSAGRGPERLQKVLAAAGLGSRRDCEEFIRQGRVEVDRKVVTELGTRVDPLAHEIRVDGEALRQPKRLYFAVNKPVGVVTTNFDPSGRSRVIDLVPTEERVFAVGRLDRASEGLILVTNDGEFANRLTHPRYGVEKTYLVRVAGAPDQRQLAKLKKGVHLAEGFARAQSIAVKKKHGQSTDLVIVLNEGRNREIRRILARVGHKVLALKRTAVGGVKLGDLPLGAWRRLMPAEIDGLLHAAKEKRRQGKRPGQGSGAGVQGSGKQHKVERAEVGASEEREYVQKQALLAEPLSLDDLLRDDLDEGPLDNSLAGIGSHEQVDTGVDSDVPQKGGVIDYEDDFSSSPLPPVPQPKSTNRPGGRPHGKKPHAHGDQPRPGGRRPDKRGQGDKRASGDKRVNDRRGRGDKPVELESKPREDFGKKRGGKRLFGPREEGRGPAGEKAGNFRFRPKRKKQKPEAQGGDNQRRGERRVGKQPKHFGKQGGRRKGRR